MRNSHNKLIYYEDLFTHCQSASTQIVHVLRLSYEYVVRRHYENSELRLPPEEFSKTRPRMTVPLHFDRYIKLLFLLRMQYFCF